VVAKGYVNRQKMQMPTTLSVALADDQSLTVKERLARR
jgi:hypothetical protein